MPSAASRPIAASASAARRAGCLGATTASMATSVPQRKYWCRGGRMGHAAVAVGAGVAGLASAISLAQTGWQVTVLERSPELGEAGAGLAITPNAVAAFRGLGFGDGHCAALWYPF